MCLQSITKKLQRLDIRLKYKSNERGVGSKMDFFYVTLNKLKIKIKFR